MSRAASLPGAELSAENDFFLKKPLVPGSFAAWGRTFCRKLTFFEEATCPRQLRCLGQNFLSKLRLFFGRSHLSRAASLPGADLFPENHFFYKKQLVPGSFAAWGRTFSRLCVPLFEQTTCPGQLRCLGQNFFLKIYFFARSFLFRTASLPGAKRLAAN